MVTQQSWMFLSSFADLRANEGQSGVFRGLLIETQIEAVVQLGRYAFSELGNGVIQPSLCIFRRCDFRRCDEIDVHKLFCVRLTAPRLAQEQAALLLEGASGRSLNLVSKPRLSAFLTIPKTPLSYWLRDKFFDLISGPNLSMFASVNPGLCSGDDGRFTRFHWEVDSLQWVEPVVSRRWHCYEKGGGYGKWFGHHFWAVDWELKGARIKAANLTGTRVQNENRYFDSGWTYSYMAQGSLAFRSLDCSNIFSHLASTVFFGNSCVGGAAQINCGLSSALVRSLSAQIQLNEGYVSRLPFPDGISDKLVYLEPMCVQLKAWLVARNPTEHTFQIAETASNLFDSVSAVLHTLEGEAERSVFSGYKVEGADLAAVLDETGLPAGWHRLISGYDAFPALPERLSQIAIEGLARHPARNLEPGERADLVRRVRALYEAGPGVSEEDDESAASSESQDGEEEEVETVGARVPIPVETFVEELSDKLEIYPISVYWLLKEGREAEGWRCLPEEKRHIEDRLTVLVMRLLGHRWPRQVEAGEPVLDWADRDGVIPLTPGCGEPTAGRSSR